MQALRKKLYADQEVLLRYAERIAIANHSAAQLDIQRTGDRNKSLHRELMALTDHPALQCSSLQHRLLSHLRSRHPIADHLIVALLQDSADLVRKVALANRVVALSPDARTPRITRIVADVERAIRRHINLERQIFAQLIELLITTEQLEKILWHFFDQSGRQGLASVQAIELMVQQSQYATLH